MAQPIFGRERVGTWSVLVGSDRKQGMPFWDEVFKQFKWEGRVDDRGKRVNKYCQHITSERFISKSVIIWLRLQRNIIWWKSSNLDQVRRSQFDPSLGTAEIIHNHVSLTKFILKFRYLDHDEGNCLSLGIPESHTGYSLLSIKGEQTLVKYSTSFEGNQQLLKVYHTFKEHFSGQTKIYSREDRFVIVGYLNKLRNSSQDYSYKQAYMTSFKFEESGTRSADTLNGETITFLADNQFLSLKTGVEDGEIIQNSSEQLQETENPPQLKDLPIMPLRWHQTAQTDLKQFEQPILRIIGESQNYSQFIGNKFIQFITEIDNKQCKAKVNYTCSLKNGQISLPMDCQKRELYLNLSEFKEKFLYINDSHLKITIQGQISNSKIYQSISQSYDYNVQYECLDQESNVISNTVPNNSIFNNCITAKASILLYQGPKAQDSKVFKIFIPKMTSSPSVATIKMPINKSEFQIENIANRASFEKQRFLQGTGAYVDCRQQDTTFLFEYQNTPIPDPWVYDLSLSESDTITINWSNSNSSCTYIDFALTSLLNNYAISTLSGNSIQIQCAQGNSYQSTVQGLSYSINIKGKESWGNQNPDKQFDVKFISCNQYIDHSQAFTYTANGIQQYKSIFTNGYAQLCTEVTFALESIKNQDQTVDLTSLATFISFNSATNDLQVSASDASVLQKTYIVFVRGSYNNGLKLLPLVKIILNIQHQCYYRIIYYDKPFNSTYTHSTLFLFDTTDGGIETIELTWYTLDMANCPIGQYTLVTSPAGVSIDNHNQLKLNINTLALSTQQTFNIVYRAAIISDLVATAFVLDTYQNSIQIETTKCKEYYGFSDTNVTYIIDQGNYVYNYYYSDAATRSTGCRLMDFSYTATDSQQSDALSQLYGSLVFYWSLRAFYIQTTSIALATMPNQPFNIILKGKFPNIDKQLPEISFLLTFIDPCKTLVSFSLEATVPETTTYFVKDPQIAIPLPLFTANASFSNCNSVITQISVVNAKNQLVIQTGGLFFIEYANSQPKSLKVFSNDYLKQEDSPYLVIVMGKLYNYPTINKTYNFTINVMCTLEQLLPTNDNLDELFSLPEQQYTIKNELLIIEIKPFKQIPECSESNLTMRLEVYMEGLVIEKIPSFISLTTNEAGTIVKIDSQNRRDIKSYPSFVVKVIAEAKLNQNETIISGLMNIPIVLLVTNTGAPFFTSDLAQPIYLNLGIPQTLIFPQFKDPDTEDEPSLVSSYPKFDTALASFKTGSYPKYNVKVTDPKMAGQTYQVTIQITDNNPYKPLITEQTFTIKIREQSATNTTNNTVQRPEGNPTFLNPQTSPTKAPTSKPMIAPKSNLPLTVKISSITQFGVVNLKFNQKIQLSETNLTLLNEIGILQDLKVFYEKDQVRRDILGYQVLSLSDNEIEVQVLFTQPLSISSGYVNYLCQFYLGL
ncbi:hypothetical protein FGO68_gene8016 [Halteria grandinella]|uniref:Uncharacterized protein n=1 Tax=Halteria grandinella TaxID=5974 RepID=A0A8J8P807_HALGN|nr:hypothetical protein FGO68_gene8016 [Halteria grandinella]